MNFLILLTLRYVFFTAALFLLGAVMNYFFDGKDK